MVESQSLQPHYAAGVRGAQSLLFPAAIFLRMRIRMIMVVLVMIMVRGMMMVRMQVVTMSMVQVLSVVFSVLLEVT